MDEFYIKVIYFQSGFTYFSLSVCMIDYTYSMHHIGLNAYTKSDKEGPWSVWLNCLIFEVGVSLSFNFLKTKVWKFLNICRNKQNGI